jgi:hypothetical protein
MARPGAGPSDKRIEALEKKLDTVLRELEALRKELKGPRGGGRGGPGGPGGFGPGPARLPGQPFGDAPRRP